MIRPEQSRQVKEREHSSHPDLGSALLETGDGNSPGLGEDSAAVEVD